MSSSTTFKIAAAAFAVAGAFASTAHAAGFMLTEQTAGSLGRAYAGVGVDGTDVAGVYYNPATMTLHPGTNIQAGFVGIGLNLDYAGKDGETANGRFHPQAIPHGHITHQINDSTWVGFSMTVPFGMGTDYDSDWNQSRRGIKATILTLDFNPSVAWKVSEKLSIGAGVSLQYASADLKMRMNLSDTTPGQQANSALNNALAEAIKNQDAAAIKQIQEIGNAVKDGSAQSEIDADSWAWGWNIGVMWSPVQNFRVGLSYRSEITHDADGDLKVNGLQGVVPGNWQESALGSIISGAISQSLGTMDGAATVSAPAWAMASVAWDVNDLLSLYASFRWTDWSSFDKLDIEGNGTTMATVTNKWKDTYLGSLGADLRLTDWWTLRGGIAYESSPISDPSYRTAIIPDADRWWFAVGSSFKLTDQLIWDVSFAHLHGVHERNLYAAEGSNEKVGRFRKLDAYLLGTQLQYRF
ncbi:OmpP1/FadL family transporter [Sutterella massiliensis]